MLRPRCRHLQLSIHVIDYCLRDKTDAAVFREAPQF